MRAVVEHAHVPFACAVGEHARGAARSFLRLTLDDDGVLGTADACPWPGLHAEDVHTLERALARSALELPSFSDDLSIEELAARCDALSGSRLAAWAFFSASLRGRAARAHTTVARLLGARTSTIRTAALVLAGEPIDAALARALGSAETVKVKIRDLSTGRARIREAHRAWPRARLRVDANGALSVDEARMLIDETRDLPIEFFEDPVADPRLGTGAALHGPVAVDAAAAWLDDDILRAIGPAALVVKPSVVGPTRTLALGTLARRLGVPLVVSSAFCTRRARALLAILQGALDPTTTAGLGTGRFLDEGPALEDAHFIIAFEGADA